MRFFATCLWHSRTVGPRCFWREIWRCLIHRLLLNLGQSPTVAGVSTIFWMIAMVGRYLPMISFKQKNSGLSTVFCLNLYRCRFFLMWICGNYVAWFRAFEKCRWVLRNKSCPPSYPEPLLRATPEERLQKMHPKSMDDGLTKAYALYWASEPWCKTCHDMPKKNICCLFREWLRQEPNRSKI